MDENLDQEVKTLLEAKKGEWQAIADKSGVSYSWISKFMNQHIPNPGYATLKRLQAYLAPAPSKPKPRSASAAPP